MRAGELYCVMFDVVVDWELERKDIFHEVGPSEFGEDERQGVEGRGLAW